MSTETEAPVPDSPECGDCGQIFLIGDGRDVGQSEPVCESCADEYCKCANCHDWMKTEDAHSVNGERMCESCAEEYSTCADCEEQAQSDDMRFTERETLICQTCSGRNYTYSEPQECYVRDSDSVTLTDSDDTVSTRFARDNCYYSESDDCWYADEENVPSEDGKGYLHDYNANVLDYCTYDGKALRDGALMFGVELEMEPKSRGTQAAIVEALGGRDGSQFILKDDGSLDSGVELVTVPLTLDGHRQQFGWEAILEPVLNLARSGAGTDSCGIHVHINKAALSPLQIGKMLVFLNSPKLREQVTMIAQRQSNGYCERSQKKIADGKARSVSRYDIANVGRATVEVRMFRGNLRHERVIKNIEFCHALVTYCGECSIATLEEWDSFADWLLKRRGQYPALIKFLSQSRAPRFLDAVRVRTDKPEEIVACA